MRQDGLEYSELQHRVLDLMQEALRLIDTSEIGAEVGAHLDLAICRLKASMLVSGSPNEGTHFGVSSMVAK